MNHPWLFAIPVLMFTDYFLTVLGAISREKSGYNERMAMQHYELNPGFQKDIQTKRWFNPRHIGLVCLFTGLLIFIDLVGSDIPAVEEFMLGFFASMFLVVIGRHLMNLSIFRSIRLHPEYLSGRIEMSHAYLLEISANQTWQVILPLALVAAVVQTPFAIGCALGPLRLVIALFQWKVQHRKAEATTVTAQQSID
jgi:hypothetical protein